MERSKMKDKRLTKYQRRNLLAAVSSCVVFGGAAAIGAMIILSETLFYDVEAFSLLPLWCKATMLAGSLAVLVGLAGCIFTKNRLNTTRTEWMERIAKRITSISTTTGLQIQFCRKSQKAL